MNFLWQIGNEYQKEVKGMAIAQVGFIASLVKCAYFQIDSKP
jgi:hypothetical protein